VQEVESCLGWRCDILATITEVDKVPVGYIADVLAKEGIIS
jgi:hypothetical protein